MWRIFSVLPLPHPQSLEWCAGHIEIKHIWQMNKYVQELQVCHVDGEICHWHASWPRFLHYLASILLPWHSAYIGLCWEQIINGASCNFNLYFPIMNKYLIPLLRTNTFYYEFWFYFFTIIILFQFIILESSFYVICIITDVFSSL